MSAGGGAQQAGRCEVYGLGWQTLTKILTHEEPPGYRQQRRRKKPKLDPFLPILEQILIEDR